jgi:hypothetical protein
VIVIDNVGNSTFESQFLESKIIIDIRLECQQNNLYFYCFMDQLPSLAQSARVKGVILDKNNQPIQNVLR